MNELWQQFVAAPHNYGNIGQWAELAGRPDEAVAQALSNWPTLDENNLREHGTELAILYGKLRDRMTVTQRAGFEANLRKWAAAALQVNREGDSDQIVGNYNGLRMIDKVLGSDYRQQQGGSVSPATMREIIREYVAKAKGGEWLESSAYNLGTCSLLLLPIPILGPVEFPEVTAWLPDLAQQLVWHVTADGKDTVQWGDEQDPHRQKLYAWVTLACQVIQLGGDKTGDLANLLACRIKGRPVSDYGHTLHRALWAGFDPDTLPANPVWPNPQGLRSTGVGLVIYRKGDTLVECFMPNEVGVDHRIDGTNLRVYDGGEWLLGSPLGYGNARPLNQALGFGFGSMHNRRLVSAEETAGGFKATWTTGGDLRGAWAGNNQPRHFVHEMTTTVEYTHSTRSVRIVDKFRGAEPDMAQAGGPGFIDAERETIKWAEMPWERIVHTPVEPRYIGNGQFTWQTKGGRAMRLSTSAPYSHKELCSGENMRGNFHPEELEGWLIRLMSDDLPEAEFTTTVGLAEVEQPDVEPLPPVDGPRVYRSGNVEFRAFPDRLERVEVFAVESK